MRFFLPNYPNGVGTNRIRRLERLQDRDLHPARKKSRRGCRRGRPLESKPAFLSSVGTLLAVIFGGSANRSFVLIACLIERARCANTHRRLGNRMKAIAGKPDDSGNGSKASMVIRWTLLLAAAVALVPGIVVFADVDEVAREIVVRRVDRKASEFAQDDDFSSPEAAYATINRHLAAGTGDWLALSCSALRDKFPGDSHRIAQPFAEDARRYRTAEILETRIFRDSFAQVAARLDRASQPIDIRSFELEAGRWLNAGNSHVATVEEAVQEFDRLVRRRLALAAIQPCQSVADPAATLSEHVAFLRNHGQPPKEYVLQAVGQHKLVAIGEIHHRPTYWRLNREIVRDPRFAEAAGTIYLELPMHAQPLVDEFLAAASLDTTPIVSALRDNLWTGWPDQAMLDFFVAVWSANQKLDDEHRIRIVFVDMKRPWRELIQEGNLEKYNVDRDKFMADNLLRDLHKHAGRRHALLIVGYAHLENLQIAGQNQPLANLGRYLRDDLGASVFSIVQHGPVITNDGRVSGRTCLGLLDEAFAANGNRPIAFSLADGPFGRHHYDLDGDRCNSSTSRFNEAFDGYVYLGRLEEEVFSPLIPGFYSDDFVKEIDQRHRLTFGKGLQEGVGLPVRDAWHFEDWMGKSWGQPREWRYRLGPVTAWRQRDPLDKYMLWCDQPGPVTIEADTATKEGIIRLVDDFFAHNARDITARKTIEWGPLNVDQGNNTSISYRFEATIREREEKVMTWVFTFAPNGGLKSLRDKSDRH